MIYLVSPIGLSIFQICSFQGRTFTCSPVEIKNKEKAVANMQ